MADCIINGNCPLQIGHSELIAQVPANTFGTRFPLSWMRNLETLFFCHLEELRRRAGNYPIARFIQRNRHAFWCSVVGWLETIFHSHVIASHLHVSPINDAGRITTAELYWKLLEFEFGISPAKYFLSLLKQV